MGIHSVVNACAHLQNASAARLGLTSIPSHKYNLLLALALHRAGFLSSVVRAGPHPPPPDALLTWDADSEENAVTTANVATRRLWLGLKYHDSRPVLRSVQAVSTPKRKTTATYPELGRIARGFHTGRIKGLNLGECLFVSTDLGVLEVREALEKRVGGLVLCRVS